MLWKIFIFTTAFILSLDANGNLNPTLQNVALQKSYVPIGFDDNDRVQLTVTGIFPSTCYKVGTAGADVNEKRRTIRIWQTAYFYNGICLGIFVPFTQVVNVGIIEMGQYDLFDGPTGKYLGTLLVNRSTNPGPDDYLYAPIDDAFVITDAEGRNTLVLLVSFFDRCTRLKDVMIHTYPEVIVAQPIAERLEEGERCIPEKNRFTKMVELDPSLKGLYLLHVRSVNGQSINKLVDVNFIE